MWNHVTDILIIYPHETFLDAKLLSESVLVINFYSNGKQAIGLWLLAVLPLPLSFLKSTALSLGIQSVITPPFRQSVCCFPTLPSNLLNFLHQYSWTKSGSGIDIFCLCLLQQVDFSMLFIISRFSYLSFSIH